MEHSNSVSNFCSWKQWIYEAYLKQVFFDCIFLWRNTHSEIYHFKIMEQNSIAILHFIELLFTAFYCIFYEWKVCGYPCQPSLSAPFSNSICSLVPVPHFGNSHNISSFFYYYIYYGDSWSVITTCWKYSWWLAFFSKKVFLTKVCTLLFRHNTATYLVGCHIV